MAVALAAFFALAASILLPTAATLTAEQETEILTRHNTLRGAVTAPCTAGDMEILVWDAALATAAQTWANGCVGDHDANRGSVGENLWMQFPTATYSTTTLVNGVQAWYDEIVDVADWTTSSLGLKTKNANPIGHFTQIVWAKSNKIGCGVKACTSSMSIDGTSYAGGVLLVCRYTPAGNSADQTNGIEIPYMYGSKCAACSGACTNGLCNAGTTPNRCQDLVPFSLNQKNYATCAAVITDYPTWCAAMEDAMGKPCQLTCNVCTAAAGMGSGSCGGGSSSSSGSSSGGSGKSGNATTTIAKSALVAASEQKSSVALLVLVAVSSCRWLM